MKKLRYNTIKKNHPIRWIICVLLFACAINISGQVTNFKYLIEYNDATQLYDCKIVAVGGQAVAYKERILSEIHYSIIVPTGRDVSMQQSHNPIMDNRYYEGTEPYNWSLYAEAISPTQRPDSDFYLVCPEGIGQAAFNNIYDGDTVTLFSVFIDVDPCENSVRVFENGVDPSYMNSTNFYNKYKMFIGGDFDGNLSVKYEKCPLDDFNVTFVDQPVMGDVNTNDTVEDEAIYGPSSTLESKPEGSNESLIMNADGTYAFTADRVGQYIYSVPICTSTEEYDCFVSTLTLTVVDHLEPNMSPVANPDLAITERNTQAVLKSIVNDQCVVTNGCELDLSSIAIISPPNQGGSVVIDSESAYITYTPPLDYIGKEYFTYQVCADGDPSDCTIATQKITILSATTPNSTFAADDFATTQQSVSVSGNILLNDKDKEENSQSVVPQYITTDEGTLTLFTTGFFIFEPAEAFTGPVDFPYSVCDNNINTACTEATLHILVVPDFAIKARVYLSGAIMQNGDETGTTHNRPLMRDDLRLSPFTEQRYIPNSDPYSQFSALHWEGGSEKYNHILSGTIPKFTLIADPNTVFSVSGEDAIVDWVFVELRSKNDNTDIISTRSGLLQRDGDIVDVDGVSALRFSNVDLDDYYVVIRHRNHLGAMTAVAMTPAQLADVVDFTQVSTATFDFGTTRFNGLYNFTGLAQNPSAKSGVMALWAGDFDGNGKVKYINPADDGNVLLGNIMGYEIEATNDSEISYNYSTNFDLAYGYFSGDFDMNSKSKFDNPNDDKNMVYGQLLFYPLNNQFQINFDFFIEQIPY